MDNSGCTQRRAQLFQNLGIDAGSEFPNRLQSPERNRCMRLLLLLYLFNVHWPIVLFAFEWYRNTWQSPERNCCLRLLLVYCSLWPLTHCTLTPLCMLYLSNTEAHDSHLREINAQFSWHRKDFNENCELICSAVLEHKDMCSCRTHNSLFVN